MNNNDYNSKVIDKWVKLNVITCVINLNFIILKIKNQSIINHIKIKNISM